MADKTTARGRYESLSVNREPFLTRGRNASELTIPSLLPKDGHTGSTRLNTPYQGLGARGVNNLASKLLLALMPPNAPFFRLNVDEATLAEIATDESARTEVEEALSKIERTIMTEVENQGIRTAVGEALKQLIVVGNVLIYLSPEGGLRYFKLDRYVAKRDSMGNVIEIITKENISKEALDPKLLAKIPEHKIKANKEFEIFTHIRLHKGRWHVQQEVEGEIIDGSKGTYPKDKSPWIALRLTRIDGEDYGRGYVEEYYGDLVSLESLTKSIVEGSAAAAKVLFLVNPNGVTQAKTLTDSDNGDVRTGNADDVSVLQVQKFADFRIAFQTIESITQRLSFAFLLNTAVQRGGERVTAEEIRYVAGELEDALGGVYSSLSLEFQLPLVKRLMFQMQRKRKIPSLPDGVVQPSITTGLEALGRGHDLNKLDVFIGGVLQTFGPEVLSTYMNVGDYLKRRGTALGIDMAGLVRSEEQIQQERQAEKQAQLQMLMQQMAAQGGVDMAKDVVKEGVKNNG